MNEQIEGLRTFFAGLAGRRIEDVLWGLGIFLLGLLVARALRRVVEGLTARRSSPQQAMLFGRATFYGIATIALFQGLRTAEVEIGVLLGAAGIVTVALGFAAQTSASNLISGLFLMGEQPFVLGDTIQVGPTVGEVVSIDLLSVKLRTFDNLLVRIPNESLLRTDITNFTRHPIRRLDIPLGIAYAEDPERVRALFLEVAEADEMCLDEPAPLFFLLGFGDSSVQVRFSVWTETRHFFEFRTRFLGELKRAFDQQGVVFPFPQRTITFEQGPNQRLSDALSDLAD